MSMTVARRKTLKDPSSSEISGLKFRIRFDPRTGNYFTDDIKTRSGRVVIKGGRLTGGPRIDLPPVPSGPTRISKRRLDKLIRSMHLRELVD